MNKGYTVLIVDDDSNLVPVIKEFIDRAGDYTIRTAASGEEAILLFEKTPVDLLLTDVNMSGMSGIDLILQARELTRDFAALVLTGAEDVDTAVAALNVGAFGYMQKPVNGKELVAQVERAVTHLEMVRELEILKENKLRRSAIAHGGRMAVMGEMASAMVHEINQPLNVISLIVQGWEILASRKRLEIDKVLDEVGRVRGCIERISALIDHVRCLGYRSEELKEIAPAEVVHRALDLCRVQLKKQAIELKVDIEPGIPDILGVTNEMEQVIMNLVSNARYAIGLRKELEKNFRGQIRVDAACYHNKVQIMVQDNGGGMAAAVAGRVFEPFFTTKPSEEGTGLGLSVSREIVEKCNGTLTLDNQPGEGARFQISIPVVRET